MQLFPGIGDAIAIGIRPGDGGRGEIGKNGIQRDPAEVGGVGAAGEFSGAEIQPGLALGLFPSDSTDVRGVGIARKIPCRGNIHAVVGGTGIRVGMTIVRRAVAEVDPAEIRGIRVAGKRGVGDAKAIRGISTEIQPAGIGYPGKAVRGTDRGLGGSKAGKG